MAQTGCVKPARHGSDRYHPASQLIESKWRSRSRRCRQVVAAKLRHQNVVDHGMTGCCGFITTLWLCQQFAMENGSVEIVSFPIKMVIFHSYVKLPEGKLHFCRLNLHICDFFRVVAPLAIPFSSARTARKLQPRSVSENG